MTPTIASTSAAGARASSHNTATASALRPRTRRLISGFDDELDANVNGDAGNRQASPIISPFASRSASPIPTKHLPRTDAAHAATKRSTNVDPGRSRGVNTKGNGQDALGQLSGLWGQSWTTLQGIASDLLGNEDPSAVKDKAPLRRRSTKTHRRTTSSAPPAQWGPGRTGERQIGAGSQEERESMVRAMKRKDLLMANGHLHPDSVGKFKRRNSDDRGSTSAPPVDPEDRDALVFVHKVRPQDTMAGVSLRFNCSAAVIRKANRMWPNDTVQCRKTVIIPVDACAVKGRPLADHQVAIEEEDLLLDVGGSAAGSREERGTLPATDTTMPINGHSTSSRRESSSTLTRPQSSRTNSSTIETEQPWKHESWVLLPNEKDPTEIARLPRRTLGFFPPARRKSVTFSDTPTTSLDLPREHLSRPVGGDSPSNSSTSRPSLQVHHRTSSMQTITRERSSSNASSAASRLTPFLGPGGVGTMNRNVRAPGPAQDGLNKHFASYLPSVAPPPGQDVFSPWQHAATSLSMPASGANTPTSGGRNVEWEQVGGAIEGWVRKVASSAKTLLAEPESALLQRPGQRAGSGGYAHGSSGSGGRGTSAPPAAPGPLGFVEPGSSRAMDDLIELSDQFEIGDADEFAERGRQPSIDVSSTFGNGRSTGAGAGESGVRSRGRGASGKGGKGD